VEKGNSLANVELFLLRNLSRGAGIGFFEERGFYPDFILWIKNGTCQHIVFVEPHGMLHAAAYVHDDKARLHTVLPDLAGEIAKGSGRPGCDVGLVYSVGDKFDDLRTKYDDGTWDDESSPKRTSSLWSETQDMIT